MSKRKITVTLTEAQAETILSAISFYLDEGIRETGSPVEKRVCDNAYRAVLLGFQNS